MHNEWEQCVSICAESASQEDDDYDLEVFYLCYFISIVEFFLHYFIIT